MDSYLLLGQKAYEAFAKFNRGNNPPGITWDDLGTQLQKAWREAAKAAVLEAREIGLQP